jgi:hypothetical protein
LRTLLMLLRLLPPRLLRSVVLLLKVSLFFFVYFHFLCAFCSSIVGRMDERVYEQFDTCTNVAHTRVTIQFLGGVLARSDHYLDYNSLTRVCIVMMFVYFGLCNFCVYGQFGTCTIAAHMRVTIQFRGSVRAQ